MVRDIKKELEEVLGKYKVIGDTTFGIGYEDTASLIKGILEVFIDYAEDFEEEATEIESGFRAIEGLKFKLIKEIQSAKRK